MKINIQSSISYKLFFIVCIQGLLGLQQVYAATYYVSPSGDNTNTGTSLTTPVKTISTALSKAMSSGDIVYVMTGTYVEAFNIKQSGITLSAYPGNSPVIDGASTLPNRNWGSLIFMDGNYNTISGFEVKNSNINGTYVGGYGINTTGHHNTISKMKVHHTWEHGIVVNGDYNIVEDSTVWQASQRNSTNTGQVSGGWGMGIAAARNISASALKPGIASYVILRRNTVFNNWGEGLSCFEADHCTIEDNIVYDNWTVNLYLCDATNSLVQRNLVYISSAPAIPTRNAAHRGISLSDETASVSRSANNTLINNLIYNADFGAFSWTSVANSGLNNVLIANNTLVDGNFSTGVGGTFNIVNMNSQIKNNIFRGANNYIPSNSGITFSNNNWAKIPSLAAAVTNIVSDPQIVKTGSTAPGALTPAYFKILGSSPVIDAATSINAVPNDFFQVTRGLSPDIGGYEFNTNSKTSDSIPPSAPSGLSVTASSSTQVNLAWNESTDNVSVSGYRINRNGTEIGTSAVASFTDTAVAGGTTYNYTVIASDAVGNLSALSNTATVKTLLATTAKITSYYVGNISATSAQINWTTNVPATAVVSYSVISANAAANDLGLSVTVSNSATSQSVLLTGLYKNAQYYYKITASSGSTATPVNSTFKTTLK